MVHNSSVGEILKEEFLDVLAMSQNQLARSIGVPSNRIHYIISAHHSITADTDLRLCVF
jgi:addiction module HigA family antidote